LCKHWLVINDCITDEDVIKHLNKSICIVCLDKRQEFKDLKFKEKYLKYQQDLLLWKNEYKKKNNWPFD